jgi:poly(3-hydroxybutyrate) depolymerase
MKRLTIPSPLRFLLRLLLSLLALALALAGTVLLAYRLSDRTNGRLRVGEETRRYLLYVPPTYDPARPTPLVISMHGFSQWPAHQSRLTHWNTLADEYGFIVVHPSGTGFPKRWLAADPRADNPDVAFLAALIDQLEREYNIDPQRIYVNGLSNGGGMSFALACQLADRVAAFGSVAGAYLYPWEACQPARPVPAILFHGDADPIVPYQGGRPNRSRSPSRSSRSGSRRLPSATVATCRRWSPQSARTSRRGATPAATPRWSSTPSLAAATPGQAARGCPSPSPAQPPSRLTPPA